MSERHRWMLFWIGLALLVVSAWCADLGMRAEAFTGGGLVVVIVAVLWIWREDDGPARELTDEHDVLLHAEALFLTAGMPITASHVRDGIEPCIKRLDELATLAPSAAKGEGATPSAPAEGEPCAAVSAPAPDREAVRRAVAFWDGLEGWPSGELHPLMNLARWWLAWGPASDRFIDQTYLHLPPKERNNDRFTLGWRACERHHAIAAPPADAGEKEDLNK